MTLLETKSITKSYENFSLREISFSLKQGELFGFLGPNGSGKTTMVKLLTGQLEPTSGTARVHGVDVVEDPVGVRKHIGIMPEQENPPSFLTMQEYLEFVVRIRELEDGHERIKAWLDFFGCAQHRNYLIKDLSRGTKQKVLAIQAFIHEPKLVFIDEPMINLDPLMQKKFKKFLQDYVKKGNTVFLSTHVLSIAEELCTSIGIIKDGELRFQGTMKEVKKHKKHLEDYFEEVVAS